MLGVLSSGYWLKLVLLFSFFILPEVSFAHGKGDLVEKDGRVHVHTSKTKTFVLPEGFSGSPDETLVKVIASNKKDFYIVVDRREQTTTQGTWIFEPASSINAHVFTLAPSLENLTVEDGILTFEGYARQIDLDRLDLESLFTTSKKAFGKSSTRFVDLGDQVLRDSKVSIDADPSLESQLTAALLRTDIGSAAVLAEGGAGKSTRVKMYIKRTRLGMTALPRTWQFLEMDAVAMGAGTEFSGQSEDRVKAAKAESEIVPTVWIADEAHALRGTGISKGKTTDVLEKFKGALAEGKMRMIAMSTFAEFYAAFPFGSPIADRFEPVSLEKPSLDQVKVILESWMKSRNFQVPSSVVLDRIIQLSEELSSIGAQPRRATNFADLLFSKLRSQRRLPRLSLEIVNELAPEIFHVPSYLLNPADGVAVWNQLPAVLDQSLVGRKEVKAEIVAQAQQMIFGVNNPKRPVLSFLLVGSDPSDMSSIPKAYAAHMRFEFQIIDMSFYSADPSPENFLKELGIHLRKSAFTVFSLEGLELASTAVQNGLRKALSDGYFTFMEKLDQQEESGGRSVMVATNKSSIFATTSSGLSALNTSASGKIGFRSTVDQAVSFSTNESGLRTALKNEGLIPRSLIDSFTVVGIQNANKQELSAVLNASFDRIVKEISESKKIKLEFEGRETFIAQLVEKIYGAIVNNSEASRTLDRHFRSLIATAMMKNLGAQKIVISLAGAEGAMFCGIVTEGNPARVKNRKPTDPPYGLVEM